MNSYYIDNSIRTVNVIIVNMKKSPDKNSYHHGDLKKALLEASLRILKDEGYKALSLRKAATYAGVSQSAPYRHYEDLESLYADIAEEGFRMLAERQKNFRSNTEQNLFSYSANPAFVTLSSL